MIITLSKKFFSGHPRSGEETEFARKILHGTKIHTIRTNYEFWEHKISRLKEKGGLLSIRQWSDKPYRSPQETVLDVPADVVGVQRITFKLERMKTFPAHIPVPDDFVLQLGRATIEDIEQGRCFWRLYIGGKRIYVNAISNNDGLEYNDFLDWFAPVLNRCITKHITKIDMAVIHFTNFRY
jgi:hypothetical protein